jgi:hypothetical protein
MLLLHLVLKRSVSVNSATAIGGTVCGSHVTVISNNRCSGACMQTDLNQAAQMQCTACSTLPEILKAARVVLRSRSCTYCGCAACLL